MKAVPTLVSIVKLFMVIPIYLLITSDYLWLGGICTVVAIVLDFLDGQIAEWLDAFIRFGDKIDGITDLWQAGFILAMAQKGLLSWGYTYVVAGVLVIALILIAIPEKTVQKAGRAILLFNSLIAVIVAEIVLGYHLMGNWGFIIVPAVAAWMGWFFQDMIKDNINGELRSELRRCPQCTI